MVISANAVEPAIEVQGHFPLRDRGQGKRHLAGARVRVALLPVSRAVVGVRSGLILGLTRAVAALDSGLGVSGGGAHLWILGELEAAHIRKHTQPKA